HGYHRGLHSFPTRRSSDLATQWDDDTDVDEFGNCTIDPGTGACANMPDGVLQAPFECYDYAFGLCPDPIGAMFALWGAGEPATRSEEHTSELQSRENLVCR